MTTSDGVTLAWSHAHGEFAVTRSINAIGHDVRDEAKDNQGHWSNILEESGQCSTRFRGQLVVPVVGDEGTLTWVRELAPRS